MTTRELYERLYHLRRCIRFECVSGDITSANLYQQLFWNLAETSVQASVVALNANDSYVASYDEFTGKVG